MKIPYINRQGASQLSQSPALLYQQRVHVHLGSVLLLALVAVAPSASDGSLLGPEVSHLWSGAETAAPVSWVSR